MLNVVLLNVTNNPFMLNVIMLSVTILSVVMMNVMAPLMRPEGDHDILKRHEILPTQKMLIFSVKSVFQN